ncbi:PE domain-containing protein [Nocardia sp. NEAU-G5]|uniref:PE domain-containing protein n=1 Tax=Nocardia albiluteola TaxID=2842303 RepID=A0ABS6BCR6_9NOCA|nr:PE domain-containing protein [Nocardia albiluteola]MBU3068082.1 PE domain-containing protein [Nocardia albiluteola]
MSRIAFDHGLARIAAGRLDNLADVLEGRMTDSAHTLHPAAGGLDPVSTRTAQTLGVVGVSFRDSYLSGVHELRKIAANLRTHADTHENTDGDAAGLFGPLM